MPLAYSYVAVALMLAEASFTSGKLGIPVKVPIQAQDLNYIYVSPTEVSDVVGGRIDTDKYSFCFRGRLRYVHMLRPSLRFSAKERANGPIMSTNQVVGAVSNLLVHAAVDVAAVASTNALSVWQEVNWNKAGKAKGLKPFFNVVWGDPKEPKIDVSIDARDGALLHLRINDMSFSRRPKDLIKDREALLKISDETFMSYSGRERQELILRFACPEVAVLLKSNMVHDLHPSTSVRELMRHGKN